MLNWLHHLFNPHCDFCREEKQCKTCETMKGELEKERYEKMQVLNLLLEANRAPRFVEQVPPQNLKPIQIGRKQVPWDVKRAELEAQSRIVTEKLDSREKEIEKLEEELGVKANG